MEQLHTTAEIINKVRTFFILNKLESLLNEFGLQHVRKNRGDLLSGGERRRCEIARCLAVNPSFILLDEPFAGVDPIAVEEIQGIVAQLKHRNIGIIFFSIKIIFLKLDIYFIKNERYI